MQAPFCNRCGMGLHEVVFKVLAVLREDRILLGIRLSNGTHRLAGIAEGQIAIGNILGDNAAGADHDIVADMHAASTTALQAIQTLFPM